MLKVKGDLISSEIYEKLDISITQGFLAPILYKQLKLTNPDSSEYEMLLINLKQYNILLKRNCRIAKQSYFETHFNQLKFDITNPWKTINKILSKSKTNLMHFLLKLLI